MNKEKYTNIVNSNLTNKGKVLLFILSLLIILSPMFIFTLTGVVIYDILLSIGIIVTGIIVIGIAICIVIKLIIRYDHIKGYHELSFDEMYLAVLTAIFMFVSFVILYFGGDWR